MEEVSIVWKDENWLDAKDKGLSEKFIREYLNCNLLYVPKDYKIVSDLMKAERIYGQDSTAYNYILAKHEREIGDWIAKMGIALKAPSIEVNGPQNIFPKFESYLIGEPSGGRSDRGSFLHATVRGNFQKNECRIGNISLLYNETKKVLCFLPHGNYSSVYFLDPALRDLGQPIMIIGSQDGKLELLVE